jgi:hypothetical protein
MTECIRAREVPASERAMNAAAGNVPARHGVTRAEEKNSAAATTIVLRPKNSKTATIGPNQHDARSRPVIRSGRWT